MASKAKRNERRFRRHLQRAAATPDLNYRAFKLRAKTASNDTRTVDAALTSETPVMEWDWNRGEMVPRVLLTEGAQLPKTRQVPLLDAHNRYSVTSQLGSVRNISKDREASGTHGTLEFSSAASDAWTKVREGHVTDVSAGFEVLNETYLAPGESRSWFGKEFTGPINVATKWRLHEASIVPIGADEQAKLRGFRIAGGKLVRERTDTPPEGGTTTKESLKMKPELRKRCIELGMDANLTDEQALDWLAANATRVLNAQATTVATVVAHANGSGSGYAGVQPSEAQRDKHRGALQTALAVRTYDLRGYGQADKLLPVEKRNKGWEQFRAIRLIDFCRECLMADGYRYEELRSLSTEQLAKAAMGWPERHGLRHPIELMGNRGAAYHVTGSLTHITLDALNKTVTAGYTEVPTTWRGPMRQAASVPDFKNKHVVKFSAAGNLPIWQDGKSPFETAFANEKESYAVEARAETASFSWQLYVNDDQDTLARVPSLLSAAAARTVNTVAWAQVTGNPTMSDGQALFLATATGNRKRSNLTTGSATPTVATLQTMTNKMMQMRGLNTPEGEESTDILNIMPVYIAGPGALLTTIKQLVLSQADPAISNAAIYNPARGLQVIIEPLLDVNSTTAWYLFASPTQVDTIEVTFLQGQETPVIETYVDEATWCRKITIVQSFAAKAIDHRGVQRHDGV